MSTLAKDKLYNFRTNAVRLEQAKNILSEQDLDLPSILNSVIDEIILTKKSPVRTREEIEAEIFLDDLQNKLTSRLEKMQEGNFLSESEMRKRFGI